MAIGGTEKSQRRHRNSFDSADDFLAWYRDHRWFHARLAKLVSQFLEWRVEQQLGQSGLPVLAKVIHREKSVLSLRRRLERLTAAERSEIIREQYGDLAGARVVFYFHNDLERFSSQAAVFESWFGRYSRDHLDEKGRKAELTKRAKAHGYRAFHFPVRVTAHSEFWEYLNNIDRKFLEDLYCEVQLRTALQDAWAETEHDLRYKVDRATETTASQDEDDTFDTLAATLKDADIKLDALRDDFEKYRKKRTSDRSPQEIVWTYQLPLQETSAVINGIHYAYELLHERSRKSGSADPFTIIQSTELFDVDLVMEHVISVKNYKLQMWERLQKEEPQFIASITYDGMAVRATDWHPESRTLHVQLAAYSDQVVTNHKRALEQPIPGNPKRKVRELSLDAEGALLPFIESPLSNTIGVACVARVEDYWMIGLRSSAVAFDPGTWGCSSSGALNWTELGAWDRRDFNGWFKEGIIREFEEEIGFTPEAKNVHYLGFAREFGRAGKPQIFFLVDVQSRCDRLESIFRTYRTATSEYQRVSFLNAFKARALISNSQELVQSVAGEFGVSEELRFNLALALKHESTI